MIKLFRAKYIEGYTAFVKGIIVCPYPSHTMSAKEWQRGFNSAYFINLKKITS